MHERHGVVALTEDYERWLGAQIPLVAADLAAKHQEMRAHEFRFLRGSYYLWLVRVAELRPEVLDTARVPLVGDLHVENVGTWRDIEQVRRWGVNDLDELGTGPWLLDLVRLATSAVLVPHLTLPDDDVCAVLLDAWRTATPRAALDLREQGAGHLAALVPPLADADTYYARLAAGPAVDVPASVASTAAGVAEEGWTPTWHARAAGTGSLGHRRFVGVGTAADGRVHAREAKELGPGTVTWAVEHTGAAGLPSLDAGLYERVRRAVRGPATSVRSGGWQVRDLAPDVVRIELTALGHHDSERLLRAMAQATADVHGTDRAAFEAAVREAGRLRAADLHDVVGAMVESTKRDFAAYR